MAENINYFECWHIIDNNFYPLSQIYTFLPKIGVCRSIPIIGGFAKRAHPARARYLNVNLARRNRDLQPGGKEIEGGGRGGGGGGEKWQLVEQAYVEYGNIK